jgi:large subunit ribosomal protein L10
MLNTLEKKKKIVADLTKIFKDSKSVVFYNFKGFKIQDLTNARRKLRSEGVRMTVAKKTLMKRAFADAKVDGVVPELNAEIGIVYADDLTAPAREFNEFQKKFSDNLTIVGGIFDGKFMSKEEMMVIAAIPSQKTLYAQFVNVINSPIQGLVVSLNQIAQKKTV